MVICCRVILHPEWILPARPIQMIATVFQLINSVGVITAALIVIRLIERWWPLPFIWAFNPDSLSISASDWILIFCLWLTQVSSIPSSFPSSFPFQLHWTFSALPLKFAWNGISNSEFLEWEMFVSSRPRINCLGESHQFTSVKCPQNVFIKVKSYQFQLIVMCVILFRYFGGKIFCLKWDLNPRPLLRTRRLWAIKWPKYCFLKFEAPEKIFSRLNLMN